MWIYEKMIGHHLQIKDCWAVWDTNLQKKNQSYKKRSKRLNEEILTNNNFVLVTLMATSNLNDNYLSRKENFIKGELWSWNTLGTTSHGEQMDNVMNTMHDTVDKIEH